VYTDYRPTPLQHYVFPAGGEGLYLVVDDKGNFRVCHIERVHSNDDDVSIHVIAWAAVMTGG